MDKKQKELVARELVKIARLIEGKSLFYDNFTYEENKWLAKFVYNDMPNAVQAIEKAHKQLNRLETKAMTKNKTYSKGANFLLNAMLNIQQAENWLEDSLNSK